VAPKDGTIDLAPRRSGSRWDLIELQSPGVNEISDPSTCSRTVEEIAEAGLKANDQRWPATSAPSVPVAR